jgi:isoleucyl-tRNA synthetase
MSAVPELKATLTLPKTDFPMKANLPQNEPLRLEKWAALGKDGIYGEIRKTSAGRPSYLLHDGPPYANGPLHLGHALNKGLKDFVVKSKTMAGFDSPYVPGFDCHGLPIEIKVDEQLGRKKLEMPAPEVLEACRAYAQKYVDLQTSQFERLGVFGRWNDPYKTMSRDYEARTLETFYGFFEKGFVYRGLKPVYWCIHDRTALADAEIEYEQHTSPSVYVRYKLTSDVNKLGPESDALEGREVYTIIWTTTPWTLPASLAVAFHPSFEYVALAAGQEPDAPVYIVASELAAKVATACHLREPLVLARFPGSHLDRATFQHPFLDRSVLGVNADYVTADQGTGAVHTAPSHGADDFYTGVRYGLDPTTRVDNAGVIHLDTSVWHEAEPPAFDGKKVFAANPLIIELLKERGALMGRHDLEHSYPHCWRCHRPVIFRATEQWFIGLETPVLRADGSDTTFRQLTIEEIDKVTWDPAWGKERITNMIATRPDWCISRQRIWGVPIAVFLCTGCNAPLEDPALNAKIVKLFETKGAEAWHTTSVEDLLPPGTVCKKCAAQGLPSTDFRKEMDILDVWFDSGSSWHAVAETDPDLRDAYNKPNRTVLYLEGGDQHRGWFHSSLLASVALRGKAPYSNVATAGWTLDELGRAMSKSLGNGVDPVKVANEMGGEIVRLWVASIDFREDMAASDNLMKRCAEIYRKLRNTFRFLLGNLSGFDPAQHAVDFADLEPLDKYMLAKTSQLTGQILDWYERFEFHRIYHAVNEFAIADLSAFYLDVLKDRMYTFAPSSRERRSAQTVLWKITEALVRLLAPILSFTADEVWDYLPKQTPKNCVKGSFVTGHDFSRADKATELKGALAPEVTDREASVHLALFPKPEEVYPEDPVALLTEWKQLFLVRDQVLQLIEAKRQEKVIGKALEADIHILARGSVADLLMAHKAGLKELMNVSNVFVREIEGWEQLPQSQMTNAMWPLLNHSIQVSPASGTKCNRCWNFMPAVSNYGIWEGVCTRCHDALTAMGVEPPSAESTTEVTA